MGTGKTRQYSFRLPGFMVKELDRYAKQIEDERQIPTSRTDVVRLLLARGLAQSLVADIRRNVKRRRK